MYYTHEFHPRISPIIILPNHSCTPPRTTPMHPQYTTITPPHPHNTPGILNPRIGARHLPRHTPPRNNTILHNAIRNHYGLQYFTFDPDGVVVAVADSRNCSGGRWGIHQVARGPKAHPQRIPPGGNPWYPRIPLGYPRKAASSIPPRYPQNTGASNAFDLTVL